MQNVAIIGAGPSGLSLAIALHERGIQASVYELRPRSSTIGGALMLSPNALRVLDSIHDLEGRSVFERVRAQGYPFDVLSFVDNDHELKDIYVFGDEAQYGYRALRLYRQVLVEELVAIAQERGISLHYGRKFERVVDEHADGVTFGMADGERISVDLLVGADGIYSSVRKYLSDAEPTYQGLLGVTCAIPQSAIDFPNKDYPLPATIQGQASAVVLAPQTADGSELFIGSQMRYPAQDRESWTQLAQDKQKLLNMLQATMTAWNSTVQSALGAATPERMSMWAFHGLPKLKSWRSMAGRVIILGDAAHAVPPSAGQGVNQAFEDIYSLALLFGEMRKSSATLQDSLSFWQEWRETRIDQVIELNKQMNAKRLPESERKNLPNPTGRSGELDWLYKTDIDKVVSDWLVSGRKK